jgi:hypothetical protein
VQLADLYDVASGLTATRDGNLVVPSLGLSERAQEVEVDRLSKVPGRGSLLDFDALEVGGAPDPVAEGRLVERQPGTVG